MRALVVLVFLGLASFALALGGCTGEGGDDDGASETGDGDGDGDGDGNEDANPCEEEQIHIWGTINGEPIDRTAVVTGHVTVLERTTVTSKEMGMRLESEGGWTFGGTEKTRVVIYGLDSAGFEDIGNCVEDGFPGERTADEDGDGAVFSAKMFYEGPPPDPTDPTAGYCGTPTIDGELEGCFRWPK